MQFEPSSFERNFCEGCGVSVPPDALICPGCRKLVHSEKLKHLAEQARVALSGSNKAAAVAAWRESLGFLPPDSVQHRAIAAEVDTLSAQLAAEAAAPGTERRSWGKLIAQLGIAGALLWKFKAIAVFALTKAKLLFTGLTKLSTLGSMLAALGLYWSWFGWKFALGFVLSIYVHEMGHVAALRRYGIPASAPMFVPGFGAVVRLKKHPPTAAQDARVGLAGPIWGLAAAAVCLGAGLLAKSSLWLALASAGAQINLLNLIPIWQLDGGRGFNALTQRQRLWLTGVVAGLWFFTGVSLFFLILLGAGYKLWVRDHARDPDRSVFLQFAALLVVLGILCVLKVPPPAVR